MTSTTSTLQFQWVQSAFTKCTPDHNKSNPTTTKSQSLPPTRLHDPVPGSPSIANDEGRDSSNNGGSCCIHSCNRHSPFQGSGTFGESEQVEAAVKDIEAVNYYATGERPKETHGISRATWAKLKVASESLGRKPEFRSPSDTVVITHPSGVHEAIHVLCKPFAQIAQASAYEKDFVVEWNRDVWIPLPEAEFLQLTPDFAFGEKHHPKAKYRIIFECAWSQPETDLDDKVDDWFMLDDVLAVVCLHITEDAKFANPPNPDIIRSKEDFFNATATRTPPLSAVVFENRVWVSKIRKINLKIHNRHHPMEEFETVDSRLARLLKHIMTIDRLREYLTAQDAPFNLNWDTFYEDLDERLRVEGYLRYTQWVGTRLSRRSLKRRYARARDSLLPALQTDLD
ncbi:hypothetical protein C8R44DRAFT_893880 [Mycena epipterygia]|nr:hypothetical protein C8R44DRAFT_893880 [Mycena epipterygia]